MALPPSFVRDGFSPLESLRKRRNLMITTRGVTNTGKTEFLLSCPGPGLGIILDRGVSSMLDNETPPPTRRGDFGIVTIPIPVTTQSNDPQFYKTYWDSYCSWVRKGLENADAKTLWVDGDSDSWELQRLAAWGTTFQIPSLNYKEPKAARRALLNRMHDSGKIIVCTNKVKDSWVTLKDAYGNPVLDKSGQPKRENSGIKESEGYDHNDYLFSIELEHLFKPGEPAAINPANGKPYGPFHPKGKPQPPQWGIRIIRCKSNTPLQGDELWGDKCNFKGLVQHIYPQVPLSEWGL